MFYAILDWTTLVLLLVAELLCIGAFAVFLILTLG
jgi:hypothetical protein